VIFVKGKVQIRLLGLDRRRWVAHEKNNGDNKNRPGTGKKGKAGTKSTDLRSNFLVGTERPKPSGLLADGNRGERRYQKKGWGGGGGKARAGAKG